MRVVLLTLFLTAPLAAQPVFDRPAATPRSPSQWRVAAGVGLAASALAIVAAASAERSWQGPLSLGGRAWATVAEVPQDDAGSMRGGGGEAFAAVGTRNRWAGIRANVGVGVAVLDYSPGGFGCEPEYESCDDLPRGFEGALPYALAGLGVDLYPLPGVGIGAEIRPAVMDGPANVSTVEVGVRVQIGG